MEVEIRPAREDDVEPLVALSRRTVAAKYAAFLGQDAVRSYIESGAVDQYVADSIGRCHVLVGDGQVVGLTVTQYNLIDLMMIDIDFHRGGLGTRLLRHVEVLLFNRYETLLLESFQDNAQANAFYQKNGWTATRTYNDEASGANKIEFQKRRSKLM